MDPLSQLQFWTLTQDRHEAMSDVVWERVTSQSMRFDGWDGVIIALACAILIVVGFGDAVSLHFDDQSRRVAVLAVVGLLATPPVRGLWRTYRQKPLKTKGSDFSWERAPEMMRARGLSEDVIDELMGYAPIPQSDVDDLEHRVRGCGDEMVRAVWRQWQASGMELCRRDVAVMAQALDFVHDKIETIELSDGEMDEDKTSGLFVTKAKGAA